MCTQVDDCYNVVQGTNQGVSSDFDGNYSIEVSQGQDGSFKNSNDDLWLKHRILEDTEALFFDADNDGDQDLYVMSGGNEFANRQSPYQDRLYINNGKGDFEYKKELIFFS